MDTKKLNYSDYEKVLKENGVFFSISELQGFVAGLIAAGVKLENDNFKDQIKDFINGGENLTPNVFEIVDNIAKVLISQLLGSEGITLLTPNDDAPIIDRAHALVEIAQGFLNAFISINRNTKTLSHDVQELLDDVRSISLLDENISEDDESEKLLMVLDEHMSLSIQYSFEECAAKNYASNKEMFVLEDEEESGVTKLSKEREAVHVAEAKLWEKNSKLRSR